MKPFTQKIISLFLAVCLCQIAFSQTVDERNAATWYRRAFDHQKGISEELRLTILNWDWTTPPTAEVRAALADSNVRAMMENFERGASLATCDFELDRSQGFNMLLPHLSSMRYVAKIARAELAVALADGHADQASEQLASLYRMSAHSSTDEVLISSLVGTAIFALTDSAVQSAIDSAQLSPDLSGELLKAVEAINTGDPFRYTDAIVGEREMGLMMVEQFRNAEDQLEFVKQLGIDIEALPDDAAIETMAGQYDSYMTRVIEAASIEDPVQAQEAIAALEAELETGQHGMMVQLFAPALGKAIQQKFRTQKMIDERIDVLTKLSRGEVRPEDLANAAIWYRRAIGQLEAFERVEIAELCSCAQQPGSAMEPGTIELLGRAQPIVELLRQASEMKGCKFDDRHYPYRQWYLIADHFPGMHELLCLLLADALRLHADGDAEGACERLVMVFRAMNHLLVEPHLTTTLLTQSAFNRASRIMAGILGTGSVDAQTVSRLADSVFALDAVHLFAHNAGLEAMQNTLIHFHVGHLDATGQLLRPEGQAEARQIRSLTADQMLSTMAAWYEYLNRRYQEMIEREAMLANATVAATQPAAGAATAPAASKTRSNSSYLMEERDKLIDQIERLGDVFDAAAMQSVREQIAAAQFDDVIREPWMVLNNRTPSLALLAGPQGMAGRIAAAAEDYARVRKLLDDAMKTQE